MFHRRDDQFHLAPSLICDDLGSKYLKAPKLEASNMKRIRGSSSGAFQVSAATGEGN